MPINRMTFLTIVDGEFIGDNVKFFMSPPVDQLYSLPLSGSFANRNVK